MSKKELPKLTTKQKDILLLLYKFRFLTRPQIQTLLNHKHHNRILHWLKDLTEKKYLKQYYDKTFAASPAVYSLGLTSRKYLIKTAEENKIYVHLLDRIWREEKFTLTFRNHCVFLADIYISLISVAERNKLTLHFFTKTSLSTIEYVINPSPDCYVAFTGKGKKTLRYFLDIFDELPPRMMLRKRIRQYFNYYSARYWKDNSDKEFPAIILICPDEKSKRYLYRFIQKRLEDESDLTIFLTTKQLTKEKGLVGSILQEVEPK